MCRVRRSKWERTTYRGAEIFYVMRASKQARIGILIRNPLLYEKMAGTYVTTNINPCRGERAAKPMDGWDGKAWLLDLLR